MRKYCDAHYFMQITDDRYSWQPQNSLVTSPLQNCKTMIPTMCTDLTGLLEEMYLQIPEKSQLGISSFVMVQEHLKKSMASEVGSEGGRGKVLPSIVMAKHSYLSRLTECATPIK